MLVLSFAEVLVQSFVEVLVQSFVEVLGSFHPGKEWKDIYLK